ncbi:MAG TPA: RodZ domain-containing protein [Mycobacteriales bacterium]|nr:RodZ domain-containing protein [Mycobacteriales bacterium]
MSVGETLSHARRSLGLSLDDVSADTRIRASVVASIENDDFSMCGGAVYARGHIRSIARVLGIDAAPLIAEFDASHQVDLPPVAATVAPQPTDPDLLARSNRRRPNWSAAMAVTLAAICVFALVGLFVSNAGGKSRHHHGTLSANGTNGVSGTRTGTPVSPPPTTVAELPATDVTMVVRTLRGPSWIQVTSRNGARTLFSETLAAGQRKLFESRHGLRFVIGNAPAVDLVINGHDVGSPPSQGNVARGSVSPGSDVIEPA